MTSRPPRPDSPRKSVKPPQRETISSSDQQAVDEAVAFDQGTLDNIANTNQHRRREAIRDALHSAGLIIFAVSVGAAVAVGIIWTWHLVAPKEWCYLDKERMDFISTVFISGVIGYVLSELQTRISE